MGFAGKARKIERKLARSLDAAIGELVGHDEPAPLEIVHAVLERADQEVQDVGRGRTVFPFNAVRILVLDSARDRKARARFDAVIAGPPSLADRLAERLAAAGCPRASIATEIVYVKQSGADWGHPRFHVVFDRIERPPSPATQTSSAPRIRLTVVKGSAGQRAYVFNLLNGDRIDIGRRAEVVDQHQRLIRTNHVAFVEDAAEENQSVSRRHAHIEFSDGCYRIRDDRSAQGTSLVRGGRTIKVAAGARSTKLSSGDEIVLGRARLRVAIDG